MVVISKFEQKGGDYMMWKELRKKLFKLNVRQALIIVSILSLPIFLFFLKEPFNYALAKRMAQLSVAYFITAFSLYIFLYTIGKLSKSKARRNLVLFTRIFIRFHIAIAIFGTALITIHAIWMLRLMPIQSPFVLTGLITLLALMAVLISGYLRKLKSSGKRRRYHRYLSILFIILVVIHILV
jgi:hypothetical protein